MYMVVLHTPSRRSAGVAPGRRGGKKVVGGRYSDSNYATRPATVVKNELAVALGYRDSADGTGKTVHGAEGVWTQACTDIMNAKGNERFLKDFDLLRAGALMVHGDANYVVNPIKLSCAVKGCPQSFRLGSSMNSDAAIRDHYLSDQHKAHPQALVCILLVVEARSLYYNLVPRDHHRSEANSAQASTHSSRASHATRYRIAS